MADPVNQPIAPAAAPAPTARDKAVATAREFETVFAGQMAKLMLENVELAEGFSGGHGEEMFRGILAEQIGGEIVKGGGFGLAPAVLEQILRLQGESK